MSVESRSSDERDYRVMLARAVCEERAWRMNGVAMKPADFVAGECTGRDFLRELEEENGEPLV